MSDATFTPTYTREKRSSRLSFRIKLYQGLGAIPDTVKNWVFNTFVLLYYNQILGIDAFHVSLVLGIAIVFDAITDPIVGSLTDNANTRWGRRHPFMLAAALPLGIGIFGVFMPPEGLSDLGLVLWLLFFVVLTRTVMTFFYVPWGAIAHELTDDYHERTSVMSYRFAVGWVVGVCFPLVVYSFIMPSTAAHPVAQLNPAGYPMMAFCAGLLLSVGALATTLLTLREIPFLRKHVQTPPNFSMANLFKDVGRALQTRQFTLLFVIVFLASAIGGTTRNIDIYMQTFFWGLTTSDLRWFVIAALGAVLAFPLVAVIQRKWDKKNILLTCSILSLFDGMLVIGLRFLDVLPDNGDPMLLVILISAACFAASIAVVHGIIFVSMITDVLDYHELQTGHRQEAMFNSALSFSGKAVSGIGIIMGGFILSAIQFPTGMAPADVPGPIISKLGLVVGILIPLLHLIPIALVLRYRITREVHADIRAKLDARYALLDSTADQTASQNVSSQ